MGKYPTPVVHIDSQQDFPEFSEYVYLYVQRIYYLITYLTIQYIFRENIPSPLESIATSSAASSPSSNTFDEMVVSKPTDNVTREAGPSFAEMVQNTGTRLKSQTVWPSINSRHKKQRSTVTIQLPSRNIEEEEEDDDDDDYVSVKPSNGQNLGDALAVALQQNKLGEFTTFGRS